MHRLVVDVGADSLLSGLLTRITVGLLLIDYKVLHARYDTLL